MLPQLLQLKIVLLQTLFFTVIIFVWIAYCYKNPKKHPTSIHIRYIQIRRCRMFLFLTFFFQINWKHEFLKSFFKLIENMNLKKYKKKMQSQQIYRCFRGTTVVQQLNSLLSYRYRNCWLKINTNFSSTDIFQNIYSSHRHSKQLKNQLEKENLRSPREIKITIEVTLKPTIVLKQRQWVVKGGARP